MRLPPPPLVMLLVVTLALDCVVHSSLGIGETVLQLELRNIVFLALLAAQTGLLATWSVLGTTNVLVRVTAVIGAVIFVSQPLSDDFDLGRFRFESIIELIFTIVLTGVLRAFGFRWSLGLTRSEVACRRIPQFPLNELLGWTTVFAVMVVAVGRALTHWKLNHEISELLIPTIFASSMAGLSLLPLTLALPQSRLGVPFRLSLALFGSAIVGGLFSFMYPSDAWALVMYFVLAALIQCGWILAACACGFRLRRWAPSASDAILQNESDPWSVDAKP